MDIHTCLTLYNVYNVEKRPYKDIYFKEKNYKITSITNNQTSLDREEFLSVMQIIEVCYKLLNIYFKAKLFQ